MGQTETTPEKETLVEKEPPDRKPSKKLKISSGVQPLTLIGIRLRIFQAGGNPFLVKV
jgi:hypothetical protein